MNFNAKQIIEFNDGFFKSGDGPSTEDFEAWYDKNYNLPEWPMIPDPQFAKWTKDSEVPEVPADFAYVNVYEVGRAYGGGEEGGWWYDVYTAVASMRVSKRFVVLVFDFACRHFGPDCFGDHFYVRGGSNIAVLLEYDRFQSETKGRPYYE